MTRSVVDDELARAAERVWSVLQREVDDPKTREAIMRALIDHD